MTRDLRGKRALVTGTSRGIGLAIAEKLAAVGCSVLLTARSAADLQAAAARLGPTAFACPADLATPAGRAAVIETAREKLGGLDVLVNNAGVSSWAHFVNSTPEILRQIMEINYFAPVELTRLALPLLADGNAPVVATITSMCGRRGMPAWAEYSASKFALVGMCESWRPEFARLGVDVVTIVPGLTKTDLNRNLLMTDGRADIPYDRGMEPDYVAAKVVRAIQRGTRELVLGGEAKKILFLNKYAPRWLDRIIARRVTKLYA